METVKEIRGCQRLSEGRGEQAKHRALDSSEMILCVPVMDTCHYCQIL